MPAIDRCAGCAEPFCQNCLVNIGGRNYCGQCKVMALQGDLAATPVISRALALIGLCVGAGQTVLVIILLLLFSAFGSA